MTHNDIGHVYNLDKTQTETLKTCWITLLERISKESSISIDEIVGSSQGDVLFRSIGYDNPDVLMLRWLRARKWDVNAAVQQLIDTLNWRYERGVDKLLAKGENELLIEEVMSGKAYFMGYDKMGRPVNYIHVKDHIKDQFPIEATEKLGILSVETGRKLLNGSIETGTVILDMNGFGMNNMDYQLVKFFINLLESYYPESLGLALVIHPPLIFYSCWAIIKHWVDPVIQNKIHFLKHEEELFEFIDPSNLPKRLHGTHPDYKYIPPTTEDNNMLAAFRADKQGRKIVRAAHRKAARHYLNVTLKWAHGDESETLLEERKQATKQLRDTFEEFVPYIHTRTHYHRMGLINEPIFDTAYEKLRHRNEMKIVQF
ncbi:unnamed protein product [Adineta steineri]|uniref:CRAL-TRIO domain-containing protein n=1 Tax=Adineta steineri TaxID=433720 RepID=A0A814K4T3_9BILA|nr:unnamed protein product [Adineta steineri]CAF1121365.1 unnamed protein product [Adineta steineri]